MGAGDLNKLFKAIIMKTPIETIKDLPAIIIFTNSCYELGFSFPLEVGIFANGEATSFIIRPQINWLLVVNYTH